MIDTADITTITNYEPSTGVPVLTRQPGMTREEAIAWFTTNLDKAAAVSGTYELNIVELETPSPEALCVCTTGNGPKSDQNAKFIHAAFHPLVGYREALLEILMLRENLAELARRPPLTPTDVLHERHAQRKGFAYGNVAMSYSGPEDGRVEYENKIRASIDRSAGRCPCGCEEPMPVGKIPPGVSATVIEAALKGMSMGAGRMLLIDADVEPVKLARSRACKLLEDLVFVHGVDSDLIDRTNLDGWIELSK